VTDLSRRKFIASVGGSVAAVWFAARATDLLASGAFAARAAREAPPPSFLVLTPDEATELEAATAQIIPTDETPGAREARVVYFIDKSLSTFAKEQKPIFVEGVAELKRRAAKIQKGATSFASLNDEQQIAILTALEKDKKSRFFNALRGATIVGMFSNPTYGGNFEKTGWKMIGFDDQFSWVAPFGWYDAHVS
jgi:gluconate 2-dehydrogenase gamma chain